MEPISNADRLVLLLRRKLEERAKAASSRGAVKQERSGAKDVSAVRALAAIEGADERALRRTVIQHILADELSPELVNDAQFQQVVTRVTDTIGENRDSAELLADVLASLRKS